ncbi:adenylate/guanylate cyclase domain-containing protein [Reyranella sp.]|uniref:adenylate/guanylate cyclase domain-containing protein n=1 Tax=Reyranella sp. TaxID=1929291 RepID=UPI002F94D816
MPREHTERKLAAILAADVAGFSRLMGVDEAGTARALREHRAAIDPVVAGCRGRIVKSTGDGLLMEFPSIVAAVECARVIQELSAERNANVPPDRRMLFRIGVNLGDVLIEGDDILGDGVNIASRLESIAEPGGICISESSYQQVRDKLDIHFEDMGEQQLKHIARPVRAYRVLIGKTPPLSEPAPTLTLPDKPSIAVLPFRNMSGDPEQEYFADGITEDISTALSRLHWFFVIARNSSFAYKDKGVDVRVIAGELGVRYVLEGSVRRAGDRLRITAQLVDAHSGNHIWAQRYDREAADLFILQDEITSNVVATIEPQLYAAEDYRAKRKPAENLDAWDCVARGLSLILKMTKPDNAVAQKLLKKAIAIDSSYAQAYSLLAFSLSLDNSFGWQPSNSALAAAWDAAQKALRLDRDNPWAHLALGHVHRQRLELEDAVAELQNAVALNPNFAFAHTHLGLALCFLGQSGRALVEFDTAERLSPRDFQAGLNNIGRAIGCFIDGRYRDGIDFAKRAVRQNPDTAGAHHMVVVNCALAGEVAEAGAALRNLKRLEPELSLGALDVAVYARDGDRRRYREAFRVAGLE